ncbi:MAG TPA: AAA family ATPase, partial [Mycobacteriales bacterium]|nr:AAA family ATPase [Mycobacteriales bacterium]
MEPRRESARAGDEVAMAMPEPRAAADGAVGPEPRAATDGAVGPEPRAATDGSVGPLELIGGRFAKQRVLKVAAGVTTLAAVDITTGRPVVVKVAASSDVPTGARLRLSHEASVLADVAGPGLVPVLAADEQGGLVYLVMPLLPGESLAVRLARGPLGATGALTIARALLVALATAHEHGVLHRDVKPGNVIIDGDPVAQVNLVDFGLARSQTLDAPLRDYPVGTARYVSPEQAGLLHREVDERSDLYSLGVLIFECLAGRPPFDEDSVGGLLRAHLTTPPPDLRSLGVALPTALNEIVQRLLRKDPNDRYQSARAALADVEELVQRLADGDPDPLVVVGGRDRRPTLTEPAFVGRTAELAALDAAAAAADVGDGGVLLVEAESGGGKSRLLEEFAQRCAGRSAWVLRGQGLDQAAPLPFQVLQGVAAGVLDAARVEPGVAERLRARLGTEAPAVRDALPALGELLPGAPSELLGPEEHGEARNLNALAVLLDALGDVQRPAVVLLDDCQWADDLTVKLLRSWGRRRGAAGQHVLVVAAFRSEEVAGDDPLRQAGSTTVRLTPFGPEDVHALVSSMAGTVPTDVLALIGRLCAGSPFMASAVLRGLVEFGALVHDGSGWAGDPDLLASAQSSTEAAVFLSRRLQLLPAVTSRLLTAGAVLGKEFDLATAGALTAMTPAEALDAVAATRGRHILWFDPLTARCSFVHDKLRETVLADVTAERRRELHLAAARHLESHGPRTAFALAYHYHAAGEAAAALPFALTAAVEARARHALGVAEQQYRIADEGGAGADPATRRAIVLGLGDVLMLRGRYAESIRWLERA